MANQGKAAAGDTGHLKCKKCGSRMVAMASGKGFRCGAPGNTFKGGRWTVCDYVQFNRSGAGSFTKQAEIPRATSFPTIKAPTVEQQKIKKHLGLAPAVREQPGRCTVIDAGPGTAKTTTVSWSMEAIYRRLGNLFNYGLRAFNVNARDVLLGKLPVQVPDIQTLNGAGARAQGYNFRQYKKNKPTVHYKGLVSHLPEDARPSYGRVGKVLERTRDCCLYADPSDRGAWGQIIGTVFARFPSLAKKCAGQEKHIEAYLPDLAAACLSDSGTIDIQEQVTRPVTLAQHKTGWRMPPELVLAHASEWTDNDVAHFAKLVRSINLPSVAGMVVDEAQDLSLAQIAVVLAQTWKTGELTLIGDDQCGEPGEEGYKAGQAIYGWRGAFGGSLTLIARLWKELTGETAARLALTVTFRHGPEICDAYRPLNTVITSALPAGRSSAYMVAGEQAFEAWLDVPEGMTALWITRTNAAIAPVFLETLRNHNDCTIRGGGDFQGAVDNALYEAAGWYDDGGEYRTSLKAALENLKRIIAEQADGGETDPNSLEAFMLEMGEAIVRDPSLLDKAELTDRRLSVGNLRRFVVYFADRKSRRVLTTVYRCKGDEADLAVVADVGKFNESWGDPCEDAACRHVALSRAKRLLLTCGGVLGSAVRGLTDETDLAEAYQTA